MHTFRNKVLFITILSGAAIVCISFMKTALELEDAEQAYYSQWWRWGYDDQPPLYTWLQILINSVFGLSKFSLSFLRALLFSGVIYALYQFANKFLNNSSKALSVVLSLVIIPTFIDFGFRRLSHTTLLCLVCVLTYMMIYRLLQKKSVLNYALFGFIIGVGLLTKYNYVLVLGTMVFTVLFDQDAQRIFFNKKIGITICIPILMFIPHFLWLLDDINLNYVLSAVSDKTQNTEDNGILIASPLFSLFVTSIKLLAPILFLLIVLFVKKKITFKSASKSTKWLVNAFISQIGILLLVFVFLDVREVETRWLLPLFLPFLVLLPIYIDVLILSKWNRIGMYVFCFVLFLQVLRTPVEKVFEISSSVHYGFDPISDILRNKYSDGQWMLPNVTYGGNVKLLNKNKEVLALDDFSLPKNKIDDFQTVFVVTIKEDKSQVIMLTDSIIGFGKDKERVFFYMPIP